MRWSFHLARIAGSDVKVHATFVLLLLWIGWLHHHAGGIPAAVESIIFVCLIFLCVLLHEFGHALAGRRYEIKTPDITAPQGRPARHRENHPAHRAMMSNLRQNLFFAFLYNALGILIAAGLALSVLRDVALADDRWRGHQCQFGLGDRERPAIAARESRINKCMRSRGALVFGASVLIGLT